MYQHTTQLARLFLQVVIVPSRAAEFVCWVLGGISPWPSAEQAFFVSLHVLAEQICCEAPAVTAETQVDALLHSFPCLTLFEAPGVYQTTHCVGQGVLSVYEGCSSAMPA